jgi:hypothetical protein
VTEEQWLDEVRRQERKMADNGDPSSPGYKFHKEKADKYRELAEKARSEKHGKD